MTPAIINDGQKNRIGELKWGLVPSWANDEKIGYKMINARSETLMEKASFKNLITKKRCIIPADGFYEWKKTGDSKQPMRILMKSGKNFSMAGLYDTWYAADGTKISSCMFFASGNSPLLQNL